MLDRAVQRSLGAVRRARFVPACTLRFSSAQPMSQPSQPESLVPHTLIEMEEFLGGIDLERVREQLTGMAPMLTTWGLDREPAEWGLGPLPNAEHLTSALLDAVQPPLEWSRSSPYQDVVMRLIASRLLPESVQGGTFVDGEVVHRRVALKAPRAGCRYHLFVSEHNAGAKELVDEVRRAYRAKLRTTNDPRELRECESFLCYLTARTWTTTSGEASEQFGRHVRLAMSKHVHLLLAHEMPGIGQASRAATPFDTFFASADGAV